MKLLVLAQTPPPLHGQSVMVQAMLDGLHNGPDLTIYHVNFRLSRDNADIGRWRLSKILRTVFLSLCALVVRFRHGCDTLYYIPSPPGKRGALYRDWVVLTLCRPFFRRLVLHWHAAGLADWLDSHANAIERNLTRALVGHPSLSIVLAERLRRDADFFRSATTAIVPNGIADPAPPTSHTVRPSNAPFQALFLGLCSEEKGLFAAAEAVVEANRRANASADSPSFTLVAAGPFPDAASSVRFATLAADHPALFRHVGFADEASKRALFAQSHCLLFPTRYPAEGMPLVTLEALAYDLPIIATRWRALPEIVSPECGRLVPPGDVAALALALLDLCHHPPSTGVCRTRFQHLFTLERHLAALRVALRDVDLARPQRAALASDINRA